MSEVEKFIRNLDSAFVDYYLRKNVRSYVIDSNIMLDVLRGVKFYQPYRNSKYRFYINDFFKTARITFYLDIIREILYSPEYFRYPGITHYGAAIYKLSELLNRKNVRIVKYSLKNENCLEFIKALGFEEDPQLTLNTLTKNLETTDYLVLLLALYENNWLITRDEIMKMIAKIYGAHTGFPTRIKYRGKWHLPELKEKEYHVAIK